MAFPDEKKFYDLAFFERNYAMLEHMLLLSAIQSYKFYALNKHRLCPRLPDGRTFRYDFTLLEYNQVFAIVGQFWETMGALLKSADARIGADLMELQLGKRVENGSLTADDAHAIAKWLLQDLRTIEIAPELLNTITNTEIFNKWIEQRVSDYEQGRLRGISATRRPTVADWQESLKSVQQATLSGDSQVVGPKALIESHLLFHRPVRSGFLELDHIIGGGYRMGETSIIGGVSGGGKTVLAMQLAHDFVCMDEANTLILTTEQPPAQMLFRLISNHMSANYSIFQSRFKVAEQVSTIADVHLPYTPAELWETPESWDLMNALKERLDKHLLFVDWSNGGMTIEKDFDVAIEKALMARPGWEPRVIIVDWVGGGLEHNSSAAISLRHFFKAAGETIINHGKRNKRAMVAFAQLNKDLVKPKCNYVTQSMLAECKSLTNNAANFVGITALRRESTDEVMKLSPVQYLCADKSRNGVGGKVKVFLEFEYQRFKPAPKVLHGGGS